MDDLHDLELIVKSRVALVAVETHEELRVIELFKRLVIERLGLALFKWSVTEGLQRLDIVVESLNASNKPEFVLQQIKGAGKPAVYLLLDFQAYLEDPMHVRLLKEIAQAYDRLGHTVVLVGHGFEIPPGLKAFCARFELDMPDKKALEQLVKDEANAWARANPGRRVQTDDATLAELLRNLAGLTHSDAKRLVRQAIYDDGLITKEDLPRTLKAKYELINRDGLLSLEHDTAQFAHVGGLDNLKRWIAQRKAALDGDLAGIDPPKGVLLLGVQGCGKSLAAKAIAGLWGVPLLHLDFGVLYNKFFGETERNLREALKTAEAMAPCVLWIDEIEKGIATGDYDSGTSQRVLGSLLTWMAERRAPVFMVATANNIQALPPELIRKGRFDEIFFVDLPKPAVRARIFEIHLKKREKDPAAFDLQRLAAASDGFSGAEIEQAVVAAIYSARARNGEPDTEAILAEIKQTRPLAVIMAEDIDALRAWAAERTVSAD